MFSLIIKAVLVSVMWFATGASVCAATFCKADEDDYNFRRFLTHSILFFLFAIIDTAFFVWSVYPG